MPGSFLVKVIAFDQTIYFQFAFLPLILLPLLRLLNIQEGTLPCSVPASMVFSRSRSPF